MPCRDDRDSCPPEDTTTKKRLAKVEAMLCSACRVLERQSFEFALNPELDVWWTAHKSEDEARIKREIKKRLEGEAVKVVAEKPFNQLTDEDKKLLKKHGYL